MRDRVFDWRMYDGRDMAVAYAIGRNETIDEATQRVARAEIRRAMAALVGRDGRPVAEVSRDCRVRCRKVRGLAQLVRPALKGRYRITAKALRQATAPLDGVSEDLEMLSTFDQLLTRLGPLAPDGGLENVRYGLRRRAARATWAVADGCWEERAHASLVALVRAEGAVADWRLADADWEVLSGGLARSYADARHALAVARAVPSDEHLRRWRRKARITRYHLRLLSDTAPSVCVPLAEQLHDVSNALGDAHRLTLLADRLLADPDDMGGRVEVDQAVTLADGCRVDLERRALGAGARLFVEEPAAFADRLGGHWNLWQTMGEEPYVGGLTAHCLGTPPD